MNGKPRKQTKVLHNFETIILILALSTMINVKCGLLRSQRPANKVCLFATQKILVLPLNMNFLIIFSIEKCCTSMKRTTIK
jgi:hypothetical protein